MNFRLPREMSLLLSNSLGVNYTILLVIHIFFVFRMLQKYGYECCILFTLAAYFTYDMLLSLLSVAAQSSVGDALPELKELPVANRKPGLNHCRRLAICRATPVYDNFLFQKGKHEKCIECAKQNKRIRFNDKKKNCGSKERSIDAKSCYDCTNVKPEQKNCDFSNTDCKLIYDVLDEIDTKQRYSRQKVCNESKASLCWFAPIPGTKKVRGWNFQSYTENDPGSIDKGFPTKAICLDQIKKLQGEIVGGATNCKRSELCELKRLSAHKHAECTCREYKAVSQFLDPCQFLETNCDENSISFKEATLKVESANVNVDDIVSVDDAERFLNILDGISKKIP